jgi:isopropylmalate/homocitrate/citramalate synthase
LSTPWKTNDWYTSPWNFQEEVRQQLNFPKNIKLHDVTLRDGEQQAGAVFTKDDKIRLAEMLAEAGIHRIEAGMPAVTKQDADAIAEMVKRELPCEIFAFARCMKADVQRAADLGVDGIVVEIPSSGHLIKHAYQWELQKAIDLSIEATNYAKEKGLYTVFFTIDGSRSEMDWLLDLVMQVAEQGHMDALAVVDTFGGLAPHTVPYLVSKMRERVDKPLETHFHDDFGLGVANTIFGLAAGCEVAHTTVAATGERAGNAAYEDLTMALKTMYDVDLGIDTTKMRQIYKFVEEKIGHCVPTNRGILGDRLTHVESGIVAAWYGNCYPDHILELVPYRPEMVGQSGLQVVMGKHSGLPSVQVWCQKLGIEATEEQMNEILMKVKDAAYIKRNTLNEDEFKMICDQVLNK